MGGVSIKCLTTIKAKTMRQIKCSNCGEWNNDRDYCGHCSEPISREVIEEIREEKRIEERGKQSKALDEIIMEKARSSNNPLVRFGYYSIYVVSMIATIIGAFFAWVVAMVNA